MGSEKELNVCATDKSRETELELENNESKCGPEGMREVQNTKSPFYMQCTHRFYNIVP